MKIVLSGFRGTGKTAVGRLLADRLCLPFIDTDEAIEERCGMRIPSIFRTQGESFFRQQERAVIASLRNFSGIISTGGGAICDPANVESLRKDATIFLLQADPRAIEARISKSDRPGLTHLEPGEEIRALLSSRKQGYLSSADFCIETGTMSVEAIADLIEHLIIDGPVSPENRREAAPFVHTARLSDVEAVLDRDPLTRIYGILGNPCRHSRSPALYTHLFGHYGINAFYTFLEWHDIGSVIRCARQLDFRGMSVTIPFKKDIISYIDDLNEHAAAIGAVNTVVHCGGTMYGYNTDWIGVKVPLEHRKGARGAVIGAGGAAAAAVYALNALDMEVVILNRTPERAQELAERFGCSVLPLDQFDAADLDVVVHATPVGMQPDTRSLLSADQLRPGMTVFDLVYTPPETPLLVQARQAGCEIIPGTEMFIHQAVEQLRLFTGIQASPALVREMM